MVRGGSGHTRGALALLCSVTFARSKRLRAAQTFNALALQSKRTTTGFIYSPFCHKSHTATRERTAACTAASSAASGKPKAFAMAFMFA
jgi:hypothetical protein